MPKNRVNISKSIIELAFNEGWHDSLYYYIRVKKLYHNPVIYNYTNRKIATQIGASPSSIAKHIKILIEKGLAHKRDNNLCLYNADKALLNLNLKNQTIINLPLRFNKRDMLDELRGVIIIQNINNQKKAIVKSSEIVKKCHSKTAKISKKEIKFLSKNGGSQNVEKNINTRVSLSNKSIGKLLNRSQGSGKLYQKRLNNLGVISSKAKIEVTKVRLSNKMFFELKKGQFVNKEGFLATQSSNTLYSPFSLSFITIKQTNNRGLFFKGTSKH